MNTGLIARDMKCMHGALEWIDILSPAGLDRACPQLHHRRRPTLSTAKSYNYNYKTLVQHKNYNRDPGIQGRLILGDRRAPGSVTPTGGDLLVSTFARSL
ncbi:hypothetical protein RRG08_004153 [Elysia crispata]|uniref:Uncharacterized protein n=1 Tax=Elysia crispata TaxID=231223 RepID=A0AAE0YWH1_9GAST|nr:hypothetical protein RRG08_004153 [Elysia crispata]